LTKVKKRPSVALGYFDWLSIFDTTMSSYPTSSN